MRLDDFTMKHFETWLQRTIREEDQERVKISILSLLDNDPELLERHSWAELRDLAEGRGQLFAWVLKNCKFASNLDRKICDS